MQFGLVSLPRISADPRGRMNLNIVASLRDGHKFGVVNESPCRLSYFCKPLQEMVADNKMMEMQENQQVENNESLVLDVDKC